MNNQNVNLTGRKTPAVGIDLGTTNSAIAVVEADGVSRILRLRNGAATLPSCVMWKGGDKFIVGKEAYENRFRPSVAYSTKTLMGSGESVELSYGKKKISLPPEEIAAKVLRELIHQISDRYPLIEDVVITVPAYFTTNQVEATKRAGELAGLNVLRILTEPVAAVIGYLSQNSDSETVLPYDLGGGTFDTSIIHKDAGAVDLSVYGIESDGEQEDNPQVSYNVLSLKGDNRLGGDDIDLKAFEYARPALLEGGINPELLLKEDVTRVIHALESLKKTDSEQVGVMLDTCLKDGTKFKGEVLIKREVVDQAVVFVYRKTKKLLDALLAENNNEISRILMVGGSTKSKTLRQMVKDDYPNIPVDTSLNPDEVVALGAAIAAKEAKFGDSGVKIYDVLPMSVGILTQNGEVSTVLPANSPLPTKNVRSFATVADDQEAVTLKVYQGMSRFVKENTFLGDLRLTGLPKGKAGEVNVAVSLDITFDGLLSVSAFCKGRSVRAEIVNIQSSDKPSALSPEQKRLEKWTQFADGLSDEGERDKVISVVREYSRGEATLAQVSQVIRNAGK